MKTRFPFLLIFAAFSISAAFATTPPDQQKKQLEEVKSLLKKDDLKGAEQALEKWSAQSPTDVELAVGWVNFHMQKGLRPITISMGEPSDGDALSIVNKETNEPVGFFGAPNYDDSQLTRALTLLKDAITTHPERTDIWMGAAHIQMEANDFNGVFATLEGMTAFAKKNPDKLTTAFGEPLDEKAEEFMPVTLHAYALRGFKKDTQAGRDFLLKVARFTQKQYPQHPIAYNDEAAYYDYLQEDEKVLEALLRAHKVRPDDALVILNIASCYKNMKQPSKAREYYKLASETGDDEELREAAKEALNELDQ